MSNDIAIKCNRCNVTRVYTKDELLFNTYAECKNCSYQIYVEYLPTQEPETNPDLLKELEKRLAEVEEKLEILENIQERLASMEQNIATLEIKNNLTL